MLTALWTFLLGSPIKVAIWAGNRAATWTGLFLMWQRLRGDPNRLRTFLLIGTLINALSFGALVGVIWILTHRG